MLTSRQTLSLNPYPLVSSISQMNGLPMRWIVLCLTTNHSWMHFERFTSLRPFRLHISSLHCLLLFWYWRWNRQSKEALQIQGRLCEWICKGWKELIKVSWLKRVKRRNTSCMCMICGRRHSLYLIVFTLVENRIQLCFLEERNRRRQIMFNLD